MPADKEELLAAAECGGEDDRPLLYIAREEQHPSYDHQKKAGALNVQLRVSSLLINAPFIVNFDGDHHVRRSSAPHSPILAGRRMHTMQRLAYTNMTAIGAAAGKAVAFGWSSANGRRRVGRVAVQRVDPPDALPVRAGSHGALEQEPVPFLRPARGCSSCRCVGVRRVNPVGGRVWFQFRGAVQLVVTMA
ncbi:hypothetical protein HU200_051550 [Digitaria exilis]|uniref:Uncharacterized protein n=1 Tax=Digitaria exilis TaxID=1010633 RepID=A0A835AQ47_9POAL|nr:hypothetical protein HU200_051550 [Digitaria exilis]